MKCDAAAVFGLAHYGFSIFLNFTSPLLVPLGLADEQVFDLKIFSETP